jgi:4-alpha-glucanotransferase
MNFERSSGILLHPTSLPGPDGIGDLGPEAYRWVHFLQDSGSKLWQILPLGPTGYGDSPYQCFSAFAGNPFLVSPTQLLEEGLLTPQDLADRPQFPARQVEFGKVIPWKLTVLDRAFTRYEQSKDRKLTSEVNTFSTQQAFWLQDFALFMAIKESLNGVSWDQWPAPLRHRDPTALQNFSRANAGAIQRHIFRQFLFFRQWSALRSYANQGGVHIIGDIPIFIAYDSADAWAHPALFQLDKESLPTVVAGVPPDYFSPTGQLWGNPIYDWKVHKASGYNWWVERFKATLQMVDIIRLDHFRGFAGYWEVPYGNPTAEIGQWVKGPGRSFFKSLKEALNDLPIIAEDLGKITPDVIKLREDFNLPGMRILQFAFGNDASDPFLPHHYIKNCVAYTGTHDNDTVVGYYHTAPESEKDFMRRYFARSGEDIAWDMIRSIWSSVAVMSIAPMQDFLRLGNQARMNFPGKASGNWDWRMSADALTPALKNEIRNLNTVYDR